MVYKSCVRTHWQFSGTSTYRVLEEAKNGDDLVERCCMKACFKCSFLKNLELLSANLWHYGKRFFLLYFAKQD